MDLLSAQLRVDLDGGGPDVGYRVKLSVDGLVNANKMNVFLVNDNGRAKLRALATDPHEMAHQAFTFASQNRLREARQWMQWAAETVDAPSGNDPLRVLPWLRVWNDGKGDVEAAAAAACTKLCGEAGVQKLARARNAATGESQEILDHALAISYLNNDQATKAMEPIERLLARYPASMNAKANKARALWMLRRYDELAAFETSSLAGASDIDRFHIYSGISAAQRAAGHEKQARETALKLVDSGHATSQTYNNLAWYSLFDGHASEQDLGHALRAVQLSQFRDRASLHTLASLQAELGKVGRSAADVASNPRTERDGGETPERDLVRRGPHGRARRVGGRGSVRLRARGT